MTPPDVSVLVPVRNEAAVLRATTATILAQDWPGTIEYLFVDGRSDDGSRAILDELAARDPRVRVLDNPAGDLASALRIGLESAQGEFVAKLDAHTFFPPAYVRAGVERLRRGDVGWVSGPPIPFGVDPRSRRVALALGTWLGVGGSAKWSDEEERDLGTGVFSGVWRKDRLVELGGWDPDWPVNEDSELASRFLAAGERIVCLPAMAARYVPRSTMSGLARQYLRYGYYRAKTASRHPASLRHVHLGPPVLVATAARAMLGGRRARRVAGPPLLAYAGAVLAASASAPLRDAPLMPPVFAVMHFGFGAGYLGGCVRFGPPLAGIAQLLRRGSPRRAFTRL